MALVSTFRPIGSETRRHVHRSEAECGWTIFADNGRTYLQLETYGSNSRVFPGKVSQTIQLDEAGARQLRDLISAAFPAL